ncbi:hypothetical protein F2Q68_00032637 [Brassica cretica]|uniref:Uncharacterized protein n=1 Tax=Brassica cretica TaxID=69181 RepID=A0A8S9GCN9_BRACR|nr:hypothetical protein F2Q68_00032637 [Brassica cretica]
MEDGLSRAWAQVKWEEDIASRAKAQPKQDPRSARSDREERPPRKDPKTVVIETWTAEILGALLQLLGVYVELLLQALEFRGELEISLLPSKLLGEKNISGQWQLQQHYLPDGILRSTAGGKHPDAQCNTAHWIQR